MKYKVHAAVHVRIDKNEAGEFFYEIDDDKGKLLAMEEGFLTEEEAHAAAERAAEDIAKEAAGEDQAAKLLDAMLSPFEKKRKR